MIARRMSDLDAWIAALEARHLANLTRAELTRALRALSSCYVERRDKLAAGDEAAYFAAKDAFASAALGAPHERDTTPPPKTA